jgi:hypothetical protein
MSEKERTMKNKLIWLPLLVGALLVGCTGQKEPATKAVADLEASVAAVRPDAQTYAPGELAQVEEVLAALKGQLASKDYKSVVANAPGVAKQVDSLKQSVSAKRSEREAAVAAASQQWQTLSADVPKMLEAIQSRVDILSKARNLPKNVTAESFQSAKDGLEQMKSAWAEATAKFGAGNPIDAVAKAQAVKEKGNEIMQLLGMNA